MEELKINGKAIYTTKGAAREYGRIGCNFYTGCPHDCQYCYLKRGAPSKQLGGTEVDDNAETYGIQVGLVFPDLHSLQHFRDVLNELELMLKERTNKKKKED